MQSPGGYSSSGVEVGMATYNNPSIWHFLSSCWKILGTGCLRNGLRRPRSARKLSLTFAAGVGKALRLITDSCRHNGRRHCSVIDSAICRNPHRDAHRSLNATKPLLTTSMPGNGGIFLPRSAESGFGLGVPIRPSPFASRSLGTTGPAPSEKGGLSVNSTRDIGGGEQAQPAPKTRHSAIPR